MILTPCVRLPLGLAVLLLAGGSWAVAPAGGDACVGIDDRTDRLACYDALHGRDRPTSPTHPSDPAATTSAADTRAATDSAGQRDEIVGTVKAMGEEMTGRHWFRLENGQVWSQESAAHTTVKVGDSVRISPGAFGSFHLRRSDGASRSTRVHRIE